MWKSWLRKRASRQPAPIVIPPSQDFDGNDGPWSSFPLQIGTPPQQVKVLISTASSQTWVVVPDGCTDGDAANCSTSRGGFFRPSDSSTWKQNGNIADGLAPLPLDAGPNDTGLYGYDNVILGESGSNGPKVDQQVVAGIATKKFYLGVFGLNPESSPLPGTTAPLPSFMSQLNDSRSIPSLSWSYTAGNQYRPGPVRGDLVLGGYDESRFEPNNISFPFNDTDPRKFLVNIGAMFLTSNDEVTILATDNESTTAFIDSTSPYLTLPQNICDEFEFAFNITWDENVQAYLVNDTVHSTLLNGNTSVVFNLGNSSTIPGQGFNITLPYGAFDLIVGPPLLNNPSRYFPLMRAEAGGQATLGRTFLQEAYLTADYERNNFSISQCTWDPAAKPLIVPINRPGYKPPKDSGGLSTGAIVGIVVGAVVAVIMLALLAFVLIKRRRRSKKPEFKPVQSETAELDTVEKDPYTLNAVDMYKEHPQSPELDTTEHKGHELDDGTYFAQDPPSPAPPIELDATERQSRAISSPISFLSKKSSSKRLHDRQMSDPSSLASELSESPDGRGHELSSESPISPMRQRSDAQRLKTREMSDPISVVSRGGSQTTAKQPDNRQFNPISPTSEAPDTPKGHERGTSDPISLMSDKRVSNL